MIDGRRHTVESACRLAMICDELLTVLGFTDDGVQGVPKQVGHNRQPSLNRVESR